MAKLQEMDVEDYLASTVSVEPMALEEEFVRISSDLAYWNMRYADAHRAFALAKLTLDQLTARLHLEMRESLMGEAEAAAKEAAAKADAEAKAAALAGKKPAAVKVSTKAPTVGDIAAAVDQHPEVQAAKLGVIDAETDKIRMFGVVDAIRVKRDMLVQMGSKARLEMQADPVVREQMAVAALQRQGLG